MNDNLVDQLRALSELHQQGSLTSSEFEAAKAKLLATGAVAPQSSSSVIVLQNELAALDRHWTIEREKYRVAGRYNSSIPKPNSGTSAGIGITIFGAIWTLFAIFIASGATSAGAPLIFWLFPLFGVFFIVTGLIKSGEMNEKADAYKIAEADYQRKRTELEAKIRASR